MSNFSMLVENEFHFFNFAEHEGQCLNRSACYWPIKLSILYILAVLTDCVIRGLFTSVIAKFGVTDNLPELCAAVFSHFCYCRLYSCRSYYHHHNRSF